MTVVHPSARCSRTNTSENAEHVSKYSVSLWVIVVVVRLVMRAGWTQTGLVIRPEILEMGFSQQFKKIAMQEGIDFYTSVAKESIAF